MRYALRPLDLSERAKLKWARAYLKTGLELSGQFAEDIQLLIVREYFERKILRGVEAKQCL